MAIYYYMCDQANFPHACMAQYVFEFLVLLRVYGDLCQYQEWCIAMDKFVTLKTVPMRWLQPLLGLSSSEWLPLSQGQVLPSLSCPLTEFYCYFGHFRLPSREGDCKAVQCQTDDGALAELRSSWQMALLSRSFLGHFMVKGKDSNVNRKMSTTAMETNTSINV